MPFSARWVRKHFAYDEKRGTFIRLISYSNAAKINSNPCTWSCGYYRISIMGKNYQASHIAWLYTTGRVPIGIIDHINGIRSDNRFVNLRDVSAKINVQNVRYASRNNKSGGLLGVYRPKGMIRFKAKITADGVLYKLGSFDTAESAHAAYVSAKRKLHKGCTI